MSPVSNQRAVLAPPRYGLPATPRGRHESHATHPDFTRTFLGARSGRAFAGMREIPPASRQSVPVWRAAFAVMLIGQLAAPAAGGLPKPATATEPPGNAPGVLDSLASHPMNHSATVPATADRAVERRPVERSSLRSQYTLSEALRSVSAARAPFEHLGESVGDAYGVLSGHDMDPALRQQVRTGAKAVDFATGLIPDVQLLRLPGELAEVAADSLEGKKPSAEAVSGIVQYGDPRLLGPHFGSRFGRSGSRNSRGKSQPAQRAAPGREPAPMPHERTGAKPAPPPEKVAAPHGDADDAASFFLPAHDVAHPDSVPVTLRHIKGEAEHLSGYEHVFPPDQLPPDPQSRLVFINGERYLCGDAGYYRATRGRSDDHWLIDAPRRDKAQVPVTFDAVTGEWQAHEPLRLCGGGCGSSKELSSDSIAGTYPEIERTISHLHDEHIQMAILYAMGELADMHLMRSNRPGITGMRDNSIIDHRRALRNAMKHIDRTAPLITQQRQAAEITSRHYYWNHYAEAFCQENAEVLFHQLLQKGVPEDRIRMITVTPRHRSPHVLVLYTEAHDLITLLDLATPQPPVINHRDGISGVTFGGFVYMNKKETVLLDPWSTTKAIEFSRAGNELDVIQTLDDAFFEIGHQSGQPYTVSVTRPFGARVFGARQRSISSLSSSGSRGSTGSLGSVHGSDGAIILHPDVFGRQEADADDQSRSMPVHDTA